MSVLHDAYTTLLSGLTHKTGNEIHWHDEYGDPITVEPIYSESDSYVVRVYYEDGSLQHKINCVKGKLHGDSTSWRLNGNKSREMNWANDELHGKVIGWYPNGNKSWEEDWINDQLHGKRTI